MWKRWIKGLIIIVMLNLVQAGYAQATISNELQGQVEFWKQWVREQNPNFDCAIRKSAMHQNGGQLMATKDCLFASSASIEKRENRWVVTFGVRNDSGETKTILLPNTNDGWVSSVKVNGKPAAVLVSNIAGVVNPAVLLEPKSISTVELVLDTEGRDLKRLLVPPPISLIALVEDEKNRKLFSVESNEKAERWIDLDIGIGKESTSEAVQINKENSTDITVYRHLKDGQIQEIRTILKIENRGISRKIELDVFFEQEQVINTSLDFLDQGQIGKKGQIKIKGNKVLLEVPSGVSYVGWMSIIGSGATTYKSTPKSEEGVSFFPKEYWFVDSDPSLRRLDVQKLRPIDPLNLPSILSLPSIPLSSDGVYETSLGQGIELKTSERSEISVDRKRVNQKSQVWIDFSGGGVTYKQTITTNKSAPGRWESNGWDLRQATINGEAQVLVQEKEGSSVMVGYPKGAVTAQIIGTSEWYWLQGLKLPIGIVNEKHVDTGFWEIQMPAGWRALAISGPGESKNVWVNRFDLWDWFILILTLWGVSSVLGWTYVPVLAFAMLVGKLHLGAPFGAFLPLVILIGVLRNLPVGKLKIFTGVLLGFVAVFLFVQLGSYSVDRVQKTIHSSLEDGFQNENAVKNAKVKQLSEEELKAVDAVPMLSSRAISGASMASTYEKEVTNVRGKSNFVAAQAGVGEPNWKWYGVTVEQTNGAASEELITVWVLPSWLNKILTIVSLICFWVVVVRFGWYVKSAALRHAGGSILGGSNEK